MLFWTDRAHTNIILNRWVTYNYYSGRKGHIQLLFWPFTRYGKKSSNQSNSHKNDRPKDTANRRIVCKRPGLIMVSRHMIFVQTHVYRTNWGLRKEWCFNYPFDHSLAGSWKYVPGSGSSIIIQLRSTNSKSCDVLQNLVTPWAELE